MQGGSDDEDEKPKYTASDLIEKALNALDSCEPILAGKFFERALEIEPNNVDVLDEYAELLLGSDVSKASRLLQRSIALAPESGHSKYMNLGQLLEGLEAVQCFGRGCDLLQREISQCKDEMQARMLRRELSAGLVCVAELWLSDLCFEQGAESCCEQAAASAVEADPSNPDAHQVQASLRISQQRADEAFACLMRGYELWRPKDGEEEEDEEGAKGMDLGDGQNDDVDDEVRQMPSYASRLAAAKMFLELGREDGCEIAADILEDLVLENEDDPELYFLLALANVDRVDNLNLAAAKLLKAKREGQTDLEHLQKAIANALKSVQQ